MYCIFQVTGVFQPASFDEEFDLAEVLVEA